MGIVKQKKSGGNRKIGRNKIKCQRYKNQQRRIKNKIKKIVKHLRKHPLDQKAHKRVLDLQGLLQ